MKSFKLKKMCLNREDESRDPKQKLSFERALRPAIYEQRNKIVVKR